LVDARAALEKALSLESAGSEKSLDASKPWSQQQLPVVAIGAGAASMGMLWMVFGNGLQA